MRKVCNTSGVAFGPLLDSELPSQLYDSAKSPSAPRVLLMCWHGLGDIICVTPHLRHLHENGFSVDVLVRPFVVRAKLLECCPYVREIIQLPTDRSAFAQSSIKAGTKDMFLDIFNELAINYDYAFKSIPTKRFRMPGGKIHDESESLFGKGGIPIAKPANLDLEVFISESAEEEAQNYIRTKYPEGYVFLHTYPRSHLDHNWDASEWISANLDEELPFFKPNEMSFSEDINTMFVVAREATHRVLSSSVFVHACDAMRVTMDAVHYGSPSFHHYPIDSSIIKKVLLGYDTEVQS